MQALHVILYHCSGPSYSNFHLDVKKNNDDLKNDDLFNIIKMRFSGLTLTLYFAGLSMLSDFQTMGLECPSGISDLGL